VAKLRRGFVKESEEYAVEFRQELGLDEHVPLCPYVLAGHLEIPVAAISTHPTIPADVKHHLAGRGKSSFSALTLADGSYREILHNDYQHPNRRASSIMHEIAHIVLGHPPKPPFLIRSWREKQTNWDSRFWCPSQPPCSPSSPSKTETRQHRIMGSA
jgi:hypothetical protein